MKSFWMRLCVVGGLLLGLAILYQAMSGSSLPQVVVYCAHDALLSQPLLDAFEKQTGIKVHVTFDNERTKSLGLTHKIIAERDSPRCDVFWNNQLLGTADLAKRGLLAAYQGSGHQRIPDPYKDPQGYYTGFAARLRVTIINTQQWQAMGLPSGQHKADPQSVIAESVIAQSAIAENWLKPDLSHIAIAKPMFGTTLTHYAVLWDVMGPAAGQGWHEDVIRRGIRQGGGNAVTKDLVAQGQTLMGWTDTDDYFVAKQMGLPVAIEPIRVGAKNQTICIPNTVAIIKNGPHLKEAKLFVDFMLSEKTELFLAHSTAGQIPLGPVPMSKLPEHVKQLRAWAQDSYDLKGLLNARQQVLDWLKAKMQ